MTGTDKFYTDYTVKTWTEAKQYLGGLFPYCMFRGQRRQEWNMATSIERAAPLDHYRIIAELYMNHAFKRRAHHYLPGTMIPQTELEWLALMQHHGAPTRLLDFTESPWVAAFFAVDDMQPGESCAVWAIDQVWCSKRAKEILEPILSQYKNEYDLVDIKQDEVFKESVLENKFNVVVAVAPERFNERAVMQQGLFLCMGNVNTSFMENLFAIRDSNIRDNIVKLVIPYELRDECLFELNSMNINRATLFPGIDGFAQSIRNVYLLQMHENRELLKPRRVPGRARRMLTEFKENRERVRRDRAEPTSSSGSDIALAIDR